MDKNMQFESTTEMSLSDATKPLLIVSRLVGMNPKSHWHKMYTVFIIMCEFSMLYLVWYNFSMVLLKKYYLNLLVHGLEDLCRVIWLLTIFGSHLFDQKRFMIPLEDFASIDRSLKRLNGFIDNRGTYRFQVSLVIYIGLVLLLFGLVKVSCIVWIFPVEDLYQIILVDWCYQWTFISFGSIVDCCFSSTLCIIRKRFIEINLIIHRARKQGSHLRINFLEVSSVCTDNDVLRDLRILRQLYHNLWGIANRVNEAYGLHLFVSTTTLLTLIISNLWTSYTILIGINGSTFYDVVICILWAMFCTSRMFLLVTASESTVAEAKATAVRLQELGLNGDHDCTTKNEIRDFLMQVQFGVRKFTACGFFEIDFTLICGILGVAFTYLVILIQMNNLNICTVTRHYK